MGKKLFTGIYGTGIYLVLALCNLNISLAQVIKFEAESGTLSGALKTEKFYGGYSGTGYVGRFENSTDILTLDFSLEHSGSYNFYIGYHCPFGDKINYLVINGNKAEITFPLTSSFKELFAGKVNFRSGSNEIVISKSWGWFYIDYVRIEKSSEPDTEFDISGNLVTPDATNETKGLYKFLIDNFKKKIISGVMTLNSFDEAIWLKQNTGKEPALLGIDFMHTNRGYNWYNNMTPVNDAKEWYAKNGIPAMMWHWRDPSRKTEEFYSDKTSFDISKITDVNSPEFIAILNDIDFTAGLLKILQNQHVPVLWRPLHEASGGWFWWGAGGPEPAKILWKLMFNRMVNFHGLKNLVWVWTTDTKPDNLTWYPGDEYVDILGVDIYAENGDFESQILQFNKVRDDFQGKKMIALSENGIMPAISNLIADEAYWSWFMVWYGYYVENGIKNPLTHWQSVMNDDYVISLDEMPALSDYLGTEYHQYFSGDEKFKIFLNNKTRVLSIECDRTEKSSIISVFDINGKLLKNMRATQVYNNISLNGYRSGVYILKIYSDSTVKTFKFVLH